jgi:chromosome partitioning protein
MSDSNHEPTPASPDDAGAASRPVSPMRRRSLWGTVEGRVISLVSRKGGVGKTTSAVNLGAALALSGHNVLVIGTDPQCGVCRTLGHDPADLGVRLGDLFAGAANLLELATPAPLEGLHFISTGVTSLAAEEEYLEILQTRRDDFLAAVDHARGFFDTILIDCPPSLGAATRAALLASDSYLVPVQAEELCRESLDNLMDFLDDFRDRHYGGEVGFLDLPVEQDEDQPQPLELEGLFLTMASDRTRMGQHVAARVAEDFGDHLLESSIPRTTRLSEMALRGKPAVIYDRRSKGSRAYFDLADELVGRYRLRSGDEAPEPVPASHPLSAGIPVTGDEGLAAGAEIEIEAEETGGGLSGFLAALGGASAVADSIPAFDEPLAPEMVSLDELLAEEEAGQDREYDDWDEGIWPDRPHRLN